jgi:hypothetical protein
MDGNPTTPITTTTTTTSHLRYRNYLVPIVPMYPPPDPFRVLGGKEDIDSGPQGEDPGQPAPKTKSVSQLANPPH